MTSARSAPWLLWAAARMQLAEMRSSQPALIIGVVQPAVLMLVLTASHPALTAQRATELAVAVTLTALWASTIWTAGGVLRREVAQGTLAANVTSVQPPGLVLLGKCLAATARTVVVILASTTVAVALLRVPLQLGKPGLLLLGMALALASATALGMLLASLFVRTQHGALLASALTYPVLLLGGMLVPLELLPPPARWAAGLVSLRWAQEFVTTAASGDPRWTPLLMLAGLTVAYFVAAFVVFGRAVDLARRGGSLALY